MQNETYDHGFGCIPSEYDVRDFTLLETEENLPKNFDLGVLKIKDQGTAFTCVAHVVSEMIEWHHFQETHQYTEFSTEFIYGCRNIGDVDDCYIGEGMHIRDALKAAQTYGDVIRSILPGNHNCKAAMKSVSSQFDKLQPLAYDNRISTYYKIHTDAELMTSIYRNGPVIAGMKWIDSYKTDIHGNLFVKKSSKYSGHAVMITGWTNNSWIIQNSWGSFWGDKGRFYITRLVDLDDVFFELYGVTDDIESVKIPQKPKISYKLINKAVNSLYNLIGR